MPKSRINIIVFFFTLVLVVGCEKKQTENEQPTPTVEKNAPAQTQTKEEKAEQPKAVMPQLLTPADPDEACGQVIVVAWKGAAHANAELTRDKTQAQKKAQELLQQAKQNPDFATLAKQNSDAKSSGPRGGIMGTYRREKWCCVARPMTVAVASKMAVKRKGRGGERKTKNVPFR